MKTAEHLRLEEARQNEKLWKKWGPYLSERQWGTVREDYSENGDAWNFFTHDHARSRAYRWGEDGLAGISDDQQRLCFALAFWNGKDPILKERLFGLTNSEGNHGEDVKEYYFYLDSTPTHSYMKYLYKYPQAAFPYADLVETNRRRSRNEMEYELLDTGVFNQDRYFDVFVEYAKDGPDDMLVQITAVNRGPEQAELHLLPTLWFRNDWAFWIAPSNRAAEKPTLKQIKAAAGASAIEAQHSTLGTYYLYCDGEVPLLFCENSTNNDRLFPGQPNAYPYAKDGINDAVVQGRQAAVNPAYQGTKASAHYRQMVGPGQSMTVRLRLTNQSLAAPFGPWIAETYAARLKEADEFYRSVTPPSVSPDEANVMRQAIAGMLWSKQFFFFDGDSWLEEHHSNPLHSGFRSSRNSEWFHMVNKDIISMPDKWEYPWYAAWDLAFHTLPLSIVDPDFAKQQMQLMLHGLYLHPNGQIPAYEWNFSDVNPPVHAFATLFLHRTEQALRGETDVPFLRAAFNKLLLNFTWWVNRKDRFGKNVFEGGFLGLDNIGIFDRSAPLPTGGHLEQADGTAWMALFSQNMMELAVELVAHDPTYGDMVTKFLEHFLYIAGGMNKPGRRACGTRKTASTTTCCGSRTAAPSGFAYGQWWGCCPCAPPRWSSRGSGNSFRSRPLRFWRARARCLNCSSQFTPPASEHYGVNERGIIALLNPERLRRILSKMLDENEFLSPYGIRRSPSFTSSTPISSTWGARSIGWITCRRNPIPACSGATPTGEARSGCR